MQFLSATPRRYVAQFRAASALSGRRFAKGEEIFFAEGLPLGREDLTEVPECKGG